MNVQSTNKRSIKPKTQYSPSNSTSTALFHLINYDDTRTMMIVANSSIKRHINHDSVVLNDNRAAKLIVSGSKEKCLQQWSMQRQSTSITNDEERRDDENQETFDETEPTLQMPEKSFSTPAPVRRNSTWVHRSKSPDSHFPVPSPKRFANENSIAHSIGYTSKGSSISRHPPDTQTVASKAYSSSDEDEAVEDNYNRSLDRILQELRHTQIVLRDSCSENRSSLNKLSQKVGQLRSSALMRKDLNLDRYRDFEDRTTFRKDVMFDNQNLLDIPARNPGEYSRILLRTLFKSSELQTCLLPSLHSKRFTKPELDRDRFNLLNEALRVRYRIANEHYSSFYKDFIQETLATCLYNEGPRKQKKRTIEQRPTVQQHSFEPTQQPMIVNTNVATNLEQEDGKD